MSFQGYSSVASPYPFDPTGGVSLDVTTTSGRVALSGWGDQVLVTNKGDEWAHIVFGDGSVTATTARLPIPPAYQTVLTIPWIDASKENRATHVAAITATGTTTLQFERGVGV